MRRLVPVEERQPGQVGPALGLHADLDHVVLVEDAVVLAVEPGE